MKLLYLTLIAFLLSSCADSYQLTHVGGNQQKLDPNGLVYISVPADGRYRQTKYFGSGQNTTQIVEQAFSKYSRRVESGHSRQMYNDALASARKLKAKYLVYPTILAWEDRATEWSGIPDKASIKIEIINVSTGTTFDSVVINGKSGLATFGGDHPQDLLPKPVNQYVKSLY